MSAQQAVVNGRPVLSDTQKSYLTLSAAGERAQELSGAPTDDVDPFAQLRAERDPPILTEVELRFMWGDR